MANQTPHIVRRGDVYAAYDGETQLWEVAVDIAGLGATPSAFREELVWTAANAVAIGANDAVWFLSLTTGAVIKHIRLGDDEFRHLVLADDTLYVLGSRRVFAIGSKLALRWLTDEVATTGLTWRGHSADRIQLSASGVDIELDATTGELSSDPVAN